MIYPKIKRLSTLNIIHHQRFDYEFNWFRTDFVGEGGAGKSLVADLLQLIFVGTNAFHSPTKSREPRLPKTLVLRTEGRGTDFAYAFLNIEIEKNQFIVIGIYLESSGSSQMFIIQNGNDFSEETKLAPFHSLISVNDFIKDDRILPIEDLKHHINESLQYTCESWNNTKKYHKILCNNENNIIPVDVSKNEKILKTYSKIIQAFSRENLDTSNSNKLKDFLFGNEAETKFENDFKNAIKELSDDVTTFNNNSEEIEKLTSKGTDLKTLLDKREEMNVAKKVFLRSKYTYLKEFIQVNKQNITNYLNKFHKAQYNLSVLKKLGTDKLKEVDRELTQTKEKYETTIDKKLELKKQKDIIDSFNLWMKNLNCDKDAIVEKHKKYYHSKEQIEKITELKQKLGLKKLLSFFENKKWNRNILIELEHEIGKLKDDINKKELLNTINDIENQYSLGYWALHLERKLSIEEESILNKYQEELIVDKPKNESKKYIPQPKELFENFKIYKKTDNGFWIDLNGIKEFIPKVQNPVFNSFNKEEIIKFFKDKSSTLTSEINKLKTEKKQLDDLQSIFRELDNPKEYIDAWNTKNDHQDLEIYEFYSLEISELKKQAILVEKSSEIFDNLDKVEKEFDEIEKRKTDLEVLGRNLNRKLDNFPLDNSLNLRNFEEKYEYKSIDLENNQIIEQLSISKDYYNTFETILSQQKDFLSIEQILGEFDKNIQKSKDEIEKIKDDFVNTFNEDILQEEIVYQRLNEEKIFELEKEYNNKYNSYIVEYNTVAKRYMETKYSRYENTGDFNGLCEEILPNEILKETQILEKGVIESINKRLKDINQKNQELNGRKLQKLNSIIDEVNTEVSKQLNYIKRVQRFLNNDDKIITGNYKAYLKYDFKNNPFTVEWMQDFTEKINDESVLGLGNNLFNEQKTFSNELQKFVSLEEKMIEAFYKCGGSKTIKPTYRELLNPKSYYDLSFTIESNKGKTSGSTSQTYASIALLCIARLSLIENENSTKAKLGVRFIPIDEAEGLGSNFDMLYDIAKDNHYQLLSLSILPNKTNKGDQNIYLLQNNDDEDKKVNYEPIPIFIDSKEL